MHTHGTCLADGGNWEELLVIEVESVHSIRRTADYNPPKNAASV